MAAISHVGSIKKYFRLLKDPRVRKRSEHRLIDIIAIALCGVIANCDGWTDIIDFANNRIAWFKRFLTLPNGIPSHDTFERVFAKIDPVVFNRCCIAWLRDVSDLVGLCHLAIDGKTLRGSATSKLAPLHLVSAWATEANLSLGEVAVEGKSNEIKAIPELLKLLDLKGALVTIDAIGCQKAIAQQIVAKGGDYLLAVKANQEHLLDDIQTTVTKALDQTELADNPSERTAQGKAAEASLAEAVSKLEALLGEASKQKEALQQLKDNPVYLERLGRKARPVLSALGLRLKPGQRRLMLDTMLSKIEDESNPDTMAARASALAGAAPWLTENEADEAIDRVIDALR